MPTKANTISGNFFVHNIKIRNEILINEREMSVTRTPGHSVSILTKDSKIIAELNDPNTPKSFSERSPPIPISHIRRFRSGNGYKLFCSKETVSSLLGGECTLPLEGEYKLVPSRLFVACKISMEEDQDIFVISAVIRQGLGGGNADLIFADRVLDDGIVRVVVHNPEDWAAVRAFKCKSVVLGGVTYVLTGCNFPKRQKTGGDVNRRLAELERLQEEARDERKQMNSRIDGIEGKVENGFRDLRENLVELDRRGEARMKEMVAAQESRDNLFEERLLSLNKSFEGKMEFLYTRMSQQVTRLLDEVSVPRRTGGTS